jgi:hypothetical protein
VVITEKVGADRKRTKGEKVIDMMRSTLLRAASAGGGVGQTAMEGHLWRVTDVVVDQVEDASTDRWVVGHTMEIVRARCTLAHCQGHCV